MAEKNVLDWIVLVLVIVGAIDLGLIGLFNFDLIGLIFSVDWLVRLVNILVGLSGLYLIWYVTKE